MLEHPRGAAAVRDLGAGDARGAAGCSRHGLSLVPRRLRASHRRFGAGCTSWEGEVRGERDGFPGDKPPHEVTVENGVGGSRGTQPGAAKLRRAQTLSNLRLWGCICCRDASHPPRVCTGGSRPVLWFLVLRVVFFPSSVGFLTFILYPLTAVLNP